MIPLPNLSKAPDLCTEPNGPSQDRCLHTSRDKGKDSICSRLGSVSDSAGEGASEDGGHVLEMRE